MRYRNKPVIVHAIRWPSSDNPLWFLDAQINEIIRPAKMQTSSEPDSPRVDCLLIIQEGKQQIVQSGDYLLREQNGHLTAIKADIFELNFEAIGD